jgi:hypothetical protein
MDYVCEIVDIIKRTPNAYTIMLGDVLDFGFAGSKSDVYTQTNKPGMAVEKAVEVLEPISDRILRYHNGNHEDRLSVMAGIDIGAIICGRLGISDVYAHGSATTRIIVGGKSFFVYSTHGSGNGATYGGAVNKLISLAQITDADIYLTAHTHKPIAFRRDFVELNRETGEREEKGKIFVNCASCLRYSGSYGEAKGFAPCSREYPILKLSENGAEIRL